MDDKIYPETTISKYIDENLLFKDVKLKKYYERNEQRDLGKFRARLHTKYPNKDLEKIAYVVITDSIRDIILETVSEINRVVKTMGDLIISGGEAFNMYVPYEDRIVTSDIDAKFVPRMQMNSKYFGKLQAVKLILWNTLGQIAKNLNMRVKNRIIAMNKKNPKIFKFAGIGFKQSGPYVTRRYTLIKKKKGQKGNTPSKGDIFIDVELFALDLNIRLYSPKSGRVEDFNVGGILDIPLMRPQEFGYEVALTKRKGITYRNVVTNKLIVNKHVFIAGRDFLIEDIYLMHRLKLRPEKKERDRQRLVKLAQMVDKSIKGSNSIDEIFGRVKRKIVKKKQRTPPIGHVSVTRATKINPARYAYFTTKPSDERLSKQLVHGLKPVVKNTKVEGYQNTNGNKRFNLNSLTWKTNNRNAYVKNEFKLRTEQALKIPKNINTSKTLYGYKARRNNWVPNSVLRGAAAIPFIGLKK